MFRKLPAVLLEAMCLFVQGGVEPIVEQTIRKNQKRIADRVEFIRQQEEIYTEYMNTPLTDLYGELMQEQAITVQTEPFDGNKESNPVEVIAPPQDKNIEVGELGVSELLDLYSSKPLNITTLAKGRNITAASTYAKLLQARNLREEGRAQENTGEFTVNRPSPTAFLTSEAYNQLKNYYTKGLKIHTKPFFFITKGGDLADYLQQNEKIPGPVPILIKREKEDFPRIIFDQVKLPQNPPVVVEATDEELQNVFSTPIASQQTETVHPSPTAQNPTSPTDQNPLPPPPS